VTLPSAAGSSKTTDSVSVYVEPPGANAVQLPCIAFGRGAVLCADAIIATLMDATSAHDVLIRFPPWKRLSACNRGEASLVERLRIRSPKRTYIVLVSAPHERKA